MARLFTRIASLPSAQGLLVFARRENLISSLLSGLSHEDPGLREASVKSVLLAYVQTTGKDLQAASTFVNEVKPEELSRLSDQLVSLANKYHWE